MKTSPKPKANPKRQKPKANPMYDRNSKQSIEARTLRPMAKGGMCRGTGAAKKGGKYSKAG